MSQKQRLGWGDAVSVRRASPEEIYRPNAGHIQ